MADLNVSLMIVAVASFTMLCLVSHFASNITAGRRNLWAAIIFTLGGVYLLGFWDSAILQRLVPSSNLIVYGNWCPLFASALAGILLSQKVIMPWRRTMAAAFLFSVGLYSVASPMFGKSPKCTDQWKDNICMQTTPWTCSPAAAATLLRAHGIKTSEQEMAELCLTRRGTRWMGLYRGLSLKVQNTPWQVEVFRGNIDSLQQGNAEPSILVAELPKDSASDLAHTSGWVEGQQHSVVFVRFLDSKRAIVADPSFGRELWKVDELNHLWTGMGIRLVPRDTMPNSVKNEVVARLDW